MSSTKSKITARIAIVLMVALIFGAITIIPASADMLVNLLPSKDANRGNLTLTGCTLTENSDGSVTFTLTATSASFVMAFSDNLYEEGKGGTVYADTAVDLSKDAFVVYDYATADSVTLGSVIAHYTRKDKAANNTVADLFLVSMESSDYKQYSKKSGDGFGVWDWGTYVNTDAKKIFDAKTHRFTSLEGALSGKVGEKITFYSFYVSDTADVSGLGEKRPEPTVVDTSSAEPVSSEASVSSESVVSAEDSTPSDESVSSEVESADTSVSSNTESKSPSSVASEPAEDDEGNNTVLYIIIGVAAAAVLAAVIYFITKKK